jgi:hypothetical protein
MYKKMVIFAMAALFVTALYGCGGGGSSSDTTPVSDSVTVKTTIEMDGAKSAAKAAVDMVVTLTLPDGTEVRMTSTGNGNEYSCSVAYQAGDPVFIKAQYGDLVLKNFFESIDVSGASADLGATTPLTTLFVDVLESMVQTLDSTVTSQNMVSYLLEGVKQASLAIDVTTVKEEVTDTGNTAYTTLQQAYSAAITWDNAGNATAYNTVMNQVQTTVEAGGIEIPVSENEQATIEQMAQKLVAAYFSGDVNALSAMIYSTGFLDNGYNAETMVADMTADKDEIPADVTVKLLTNETTAVKMTQSDPAYGTLSGSGSLMYRIYMKHHIQGVIANQVYYEEAYDDQKSGEPGMILQKINGAWYLRGNQQKAEYWTALNTDSNWASRYAYAQVCEGNTDISTVTVTSNAFTGDVYIGQNPYELECRSIQIFENGEVWGWGSSQFMKLGTVNFTAQNLCGRTLTYTVSFTDKTTETKTVTIPACVAKTVTATAEKNGDGSVTVSYTLPDDEDISEVDINVDGQQTGIGNSGNMYNKENLPFAARAYTFESSLFQTGYTYSFRVAYTDKYARQYVAKAATINY